MGDKTSCSLNFDSYNGWLTGMCLDLLIFSNARTTVAVPPLLDKPIKLMVKSFSFVFECLANSCRVVSPAGLTHKGSQFYGSCSYQELIINLIDICRYKVETLFVSEERLCPKLLTDEFLNSAFLFNFCGLLLGWRKEQQEPYHLSLVPGEGREEYRFQCKTVGFCSPLQYDLTFLLLITSLKYNIPSEGKNFFFFVRFFSFNRLWNFVEKLFLVLLFAGLICVLSPDTMVKHDALVLIRVP